MATKHPKIVGIAHGIDKALYIIIVPFPDWQSVRQALIRLDLSNLGWLD
jgi:hypothetical protein